MLYNCYVLNNNYIVEWEIITNNYITVTWCLLGFYDTYILYQSKYVCFYNYLYENYANDSKKFFLCKFEKRNKINKKSQFIYQISIPVATGEFGKYFSLS